MSVMSTLRRGVIEPLWARSRGSVLRETWHELEETPSLPTSVLRERQWQRLVTLIEFVYEHNDFYRRRLDECGAAPETLRDWDDFQRIPVLRKQDVRALGTSLISKGFDRASLMKAKTGGSTGRPLEVYFTELVSEQRSACARRHRRWTGWEVGEPWAAVWGNPQYPTTLRDKLREQLLDPIIFLDTMSVSADSVRRFAEEWVRVRPTLLFGHAHSVFLLADLLRQLGIDEIRPKGIIASSMMLLPHERVVIEQVFGRKVFDIYGCEEVGLIGGECERHDGLHMNVDQLVVELLDDSGKVVEPGERGVVVVTDLQNLAMPFIRYCMEDMSEARAPACPCGRGLPLMGRITGRVADFLKRQDGSRVAGISLIENSLTKITGIDQMQIVQERMDLLRLIVVPGPTFTPERRQELLRYFERTFTGSRVELEEVSEIRPEPNGKYRFSICRVPD
jgi:phenylacetate-coenzyme A ligase PaaK-like adenylate-forming protein